MNRRERVLDAVKLGGAYIAYCIGSGYATGQEIMQFFTSYGWMGLAASAVSLVLFVWLGMSLMKVGRSLPPEEEGGSVYRYYCGNGLGTALEWFTVIFSFGVFTIMLAGAGATLNEYWGLPSFAGSALMGALALITVFMGLDKLIGIIGIIGPVIIVFSLFIGGASAVSNIGSLSTLSQTMESVTIAQPTGNWLFAGALYTGYNAILLVPFLAQLSGVAKTRKTGIAGGFIGGFFLVLAIIVMNLGLLCNIGSVYDKAIPTLALARSIHPLLAGSFVFILLGGIYSTAIPLLWMFCRRLATEKTRRYNIICVAAVAAAIVLSHLPFTELVGIVYPYTGYMGVIVMGFILVKQISVRFKKAHGAASAASAETQPASDNI